MTLRVCTEIGTPWIFNMLCSIQLKWQGAAGSGLTPRQSQARKMRPMLRPLEVLRLFPPHAGTLAALLDSRAAVAPDRECLVFEQRSISYAELRQRAGRAAAWLQQ